MPFNHIDTTRRRGAKLSAKDDRRHPPSPPCHGPNAKPPAVHGRKESTMTTAHHTLVRLQAQAALPRMVCSPLSPPHAQRTTCLPQPHHDRGDRSAMPRLYVRLGPNGVGSYLGPRSQQPGASGHGSAPRIAGCRGRSRQTRGCAPMGLTEGCFTCRQSICDRGS